MSDITITALNGENYIFNLLKYEMELDDDQAFIRNNDYVLPDDEDGLFVAVGMVDSQVFANSNKTEPNDAGMQETQRVLMRENIQVDIFSKNTDALTRRWEVVAALRSVFSQQLQEQYQFKIFSIPSSFINTTDTEGADRIHKFSIIIPLHVWYAKQKQIGNAYDDNGDYFTSFSTVGEDEQTIEDDTHIFEFTLTE